MSPLVRRVLLAFVILFPGLVSAQLSKDDQKCINSVNKSAAQIAGAVSKELCACIKQGAKGKLAVSIEACLTEDPKGKVA